MMLSEKREEFIIFSKKQVDAAIAVNEIANRFISGLPLLVGDYYMITFSAEWFGKAEVNSCKRILKSYNIKYKICKFKD